MPRRDDTTVPLPGITVADAGHGGRVGPGSLDGVHVLVLMRHRH